MELSIRCSGGHTTPIVAGRGDDNAICDRIDEAKSADPASRAGDPKPGVAFGGRHCSHKLIWLGVERMRAKMAAGCKATCRREAPDNLTVSD